MDQKEFVAKESQSESWENHVTMEYQCESMENSAQATQNNVQHKEEMHQIELRNSQIILDNIKMQEKEQNTKVKLLGKRKKSEL